MKKTDEKVRESIIEIISCLRPFLNSEGGDIEFVKYENKIVYIKMIGACANCQMLDYTLRDGIEATIKNEIPEVESVVNLSD